MFNLRLLSRALPLSAFGELSIGAHRENFSADLGVWDEEDYQASWLRSAAHIIEHGYGRFLVSAPGNGMYETWVCRATGATVRLYKSIMLSTATERFDTPADAETPADEYAIKESPMLNCYHCNLVDIADFEARLRGRVVN
ncbi:MAG: hypothetical protein QM759_16470 [Terricaulis sp.]